MNTGENIDADMVYENTMSFSLDYNIQYDIIYM